MASRAIPRYGATACLCPVFLCGSPPRRGTVLRVGLDQVLRERRGLRAQRGGGRLQAPGRTCTGSRTVGTVISSPGLRAPRGSVCSLSTQPVCSFGSRSLTFNCLSPGGADAEGLVCLRSLSGRTSSRAWFGEQMAGTLSREEDPVLST